MMGELVDSPKERLLQVPLVLNHTLTVPKDTRVRDTNVHCLVVMVTGDYKHRSMCICLCGYIHLDAGTCGG